MEKADLSIACSDDDEGVPLSANNDAEEGSAREMAPPIEREEEDVSNEELDDAGVERDERLPIADHEAVVQDADIELRENVVGSTDQDDAFSAYLVLDPEETRRRMLQDTVSATNVRVVPPAEPEGKNNKWKAPIIILVVVIAAAIGISLGLTRSRTNNDESSQSTSPTVAPTSTRFDQVASIVESLFHTTFEDLSSPQYQAAQWIADEDMLFDDLSTVDLDQFNQRYVLVLFYFATGGLTSWIDTSFFLKPGVHECDWWDTAPEDTAAFSETRGVNFCSTEKFVLSLEINQNNLTGTLPHELGSLSFLVWLSVTANRVGATVPPSLFDVTELQDLYLWWNELTGPMPTEIGRASSLRILGLGENFLEGTIPTEIGNLSNLEALFLPTNSLTGTIPDSLLRLSNLLLVDVGLNSLTGTLPPSLFLSWPNLQTFSVSDNMLSGTIPNNLYSLTHLKSIYFTRNNFTGPFPSSIATLANVTTIGVEDNNLTGTLPNDWSNLSMSLGWLFVGFNSLTGTIPESLGNLSRLEYLFLAVNNLNGTIPESLGNATKLSQLYLTSNQFTGTVSASFIQLTSLQRLYLQGNELIGDLSFLCNGTNKLFPTLRDFRSDCFEELDCPCCNYCCNNYTCRDV